MKIKKLYIDGMFGDFTYNLNFEDIKDNVIILTAPNGYGKSTILKIIDDFFNMKFDDLFDESFNLFTIEFDDQIVTVVKENNLLVIYYGLGKVVEINKNIFRDNKKKFNNILKNELSYMKKVKNNLWIDTRDDEVINTREMLERYNYIFPEDIVHVKLDDDLLQLLERDVFFVDADRLNNINVSENNQEYSAINKLSKSIRQLMVDVKEKQYAISMDQSSNFPEKVMSLLSEDIDIDVTKTINKIVKITRFDREYNENEIFGNLNLNPNIIGKLRNEQIYDNKAFLMVLSSYLDDIIQRIDTCAELAERINLFKESVNSLLQFKNIDIHPAFGLIVEKKKDKDRVQDEKEIVDKKKIKSFNNGDFSINLLSSGEKHLIILLGDLIFNTKYGSVVLIDEPEISLHAAWQKKLLGLIEKISQINNFNVLIATHSFTLINGNWDNTIELAELIK
ncbi:AAA family ATPase [Acinetobacter pittii]|uniref:AAA family ATPase n=1 Tax=Acinetobacter pittii TaxID=48296 RepID=UPI00190066B1|nr:AAA family ATPase [Acinetobacter pittii]MBJ8433647.1 AAA family ATPase [Acinetobacter pittii]